ncbi:MAG: glycosyltransferase family 4 protein [Sediminibacterium sp.]
MDTTDKYGQINNSKQILAIGSEWFSRKGGLSTFNRVLCTTLAKSGHKVFCYVPSFTPDENDHAIQHNVILIKPKAAVGLDEFERLFKKAALPENILPDIIIGHGLVTGPYMQSQKDDYFPQSQTILFVHTAPGEIEFFKPEKAIESVAEKAELKDNEQKALAERADLVAAVGPHLYYETKSLLAGLDKQPNLILFNPGLSKPFQEIDFTSTNPTPEALMVGRIEDFTLKGVDIGVLSMHQLYNRWDIKTNGFDIKPRLIIRGAPIGTDVELIRKLKELEQSNLRIQPKNYSPDMDVINEDIRKSAVVLVPSRAEGFGLIALEAISNGRPVLISSESGLGRLLMKMIPEEAGDWIISPDEKHPEKWADQIYAIFKDRKAASERVRKIAECYEKNITWEKSVDDMLAFLADWKQGDHETTFHSEITGGNEWPKNLGDGTFEHQDGRFEIKRRKYDFFASRLAAAFPGIRGLEWINDPKVVIQRLKILLAAPLAFTIYPGRDDDVGGTTKPIWWFRAGESMDIEDFESLSETKCMIGGIELEIDKIAVYRSQMHYRSFVYLKAKAEQSALPNTDIAQRIESQLSYKEYAEEEFALYKGQAITREEFDDGSAIIDGRPVRFTEHPDLRTRFLTPFNMLICSQTSVYNTHSADSMLQDIMDGLLDEENEKLMPKYIKQLQTIKQEEVKARDFDDFE